MGISGNEEDSYQSCLSRAFFLRENPALCFSSFSPSARNPHIQPVMTFRLRAFLNPFPYLLIEVTWNSISDPSFDCFFFTFQFVLFSPLVDNSSFLPCRSLLEWGVQLSTIPVFLLTFSHALRNLYNVLPGFSRVQRSFPTAPFFFPFRFKDLR